MDLFIQQEGITHSHQKLIKFRKRVNVISKNRRNLVFDFSSMTNKNPNLVRFLLMIELLNTTVNGRVMT